MKIRKYRYMGMPSTSDYWDFQEVCFGDLNLIVGDTASGKTTFLSTIFNLGSAIASKSIVFGSWEITFADDTDEYEYKFCAEKEGNAEGKIKLESLIAIKNNVSVKIIERNDRTFVFEGRDMPRLSNQETAISLLRLEDSVKPIYSHFSMIMRRLFSGSELDVAKQIVPAPESIKKVFQKDKKLNDLFGMSLPLNMKLEILSMYFPSIFSRIVKLFRSAFPFVKSAKMEIASEPSRGVGVPLGASVFTLHEKDVKRSVTLPEFSSGMLKVLLLVCDVCTLPKGSSYLIDEYENSLGMSAINFLPSLLNELDSDCQYFLTSHHPYIINNIPTESWYVFSRVGSNVSIRHGNELVELYGKSSQQAFVKLMNDPFFYGVQG